MLFSLFDLGYVDGMFNCNIGTILGSEGDGVSVFSVRGDWSTKLFTIEILGWEFEVNVGKNEQ